ncbi:MAG: division/cell wall cluster transcriptional repressor MraZ [Parvibaculales bacterium]
MQVFLSTIAGKIDAKGRVLIPASFRNVAIAQGFSGIYLYPSFTKKIIEGGGQVLIDHFSQSISNIDPFEEGSDELALALLGRSQKLGFDGDGRITLPQELLTHAEIKQDLYFVGLGAKFQIWQQQAFDVYRKTASEKALKHRGLLRALSAPPKETKT